MYTKVLVPAVGILATFAVCQPILTPNQSAVPGVFIPVDTLKNLEDRANQNTNPQNSASNDQRSDAPLRQNSGNSQSYPPQNVGSMTPNSQQPSYTNYQQPINQPRGINQQPSVNNQQPELANQQPIAMNQPAMSYQPSVPNQLMNQQPLPLNQQPGGNQQQNMMYLQPSANIQQPGVMNQQPTITLQPVATNQQPLLMNQQPGTGQLIPVNQQPLIINQQPLPNQQLYVSTENRPNQRFLVTQPNQQAILVTGQSTGNQPMLVTTGQQPNQNLLIQNGQATLIANPNGSVMTKPVDNQGVYAVVPLNNQNVPNNNLNTYLVPVQQVPSTSLVVNTGK